jgi:hypothetical protein
MIRDIRDVLEDWGFDPQNNIRIIVGHNGVPVMQVRLPLGLEQYELDGRPDSLHPNGHATWLDAVEQRLAATLADRHASPFSITAEEFLNLQNESILFYYRYMLLFQMNDFDRVVRDTDHNLRVSELVDQYYPDDEGRLAVLQFRPYIIRMNAMARSMQRLQQNDFSACVDILESAIGRIEALEPLPSPAFQYERSRSMTYLRTAMEQLRSQQPDEKKKLEEELEQAVQQEDYEHAAQLRDEIRLLIDKAKSA